MMLRAHRMVISRGLEAERKPAFSVMSRWAVRKLSCSRREEMGTGVEVRKGSM